MAPERVTKSGGSSPSQVLSTIVGLPSYAGAAPAWHEVQALHHLVEVRAERAEQRGPGRGAAQGPATAQQARERPLQAGPGERSAEPARVSTSRDFHTILGGSLL